MTATPADTMRMGNAAKALLSAAVWHSWINADHWARAAASVAAGSGPAPIVIGSNKATIAASDPFPGPQVPPTAGFGGAPRRPVIAKAAPKSPRMTSTSLVHRMAVGGSCKITLHPVRWEAEDCMTITSLHRTHG